MATLSYLQSHRACASYLKRMPLFLRIFSYTLPVKKRESISSVLAFSLFAEDGMVFAKTPGEKQAHLNNCLEILAGVYDQNGREFRNPIEPAFEQTIFRYGLPKKLFDRFLLGINMKFHRGEFSNTNELVDYAHHRKGSLFAIFSYFLDSVGSIKESAVALGIALEINNLAKQMRPEFQKQCKSIAEEYFLEGFKGISLLRPSRYRLLFTLVARIYGRRNGLLSEKPLAKHLALGNRS